MLVGLVLQLAELRRGQQTCALSLSLSLSLSRQLDGSIELGKGQGVE